MLSGPAHPAAQGSRRSGPGEARRAGVVGSPVQHSLSPVLHRAAFAALGLTGWTYDRVEVGRGRLADHVRSLGPQWVGLSVTMPGKEEALALAEEVTPRARLAGGANTLVRRGDGWFADNTDVPGLAEALRLELDRSGAGPVHRAVVLGGGATARSAVLALQDLRAREITLMVRERVRPETQELIRRLAASSDAPRLDVRALADGLSLERATAQVVVGTLPAKAPAPPLRWAGGAARPPVVLDVSYAPWPSRLARAVTAATEGRVRVVRGTTMLLHQAVEQVELMTGLRGPVEAMAEALAGHLEDAG